MKIAPKQCISWKTCGGVEEFCTNCQMGDTSESICIYFPKMNEVQRFKFNRIYINDKFKQFLQ